MLFWKSDNLTQSSLNLDNFYKLFLHISPYHSKKIFLAKHLLKCTIFSSLSPLRKMWPQTFISKKLLFYYCWFTILLMVSHRLKLKRQIWYYFLSSSRFIIISSFLSYLKYINLYIPSALTNECRITFEKYLMRFSK